MVSDPRDGSGAKTQVSGPEGPLTISALGMTRTFNLLIRRLQRVSESLSRVRTVP